MTSFISKTISEETEGSVPRLQLLLLENFKTGKKIRAFFTSKLHLDAVLNMRQQCMGALRNRNHHLIEHSIGHVEQKRLFL
jgi:hypothetical protein